MHDADDDEAGGRPSPPASPADRPWRHPSEVALHARTHADRRRARALSASIVVGGLGLAVLGFVLGANRGADSDEGARAQPDGSYGPSVARLTVVGPDGETHGATGVVLDDAGHVIVRARSIEGSESIWATCGSGPATEAELVAADPVSDVAVVRLAAPDGSALEVGQQPAVGHRVVAVRNIVERDLRVRSAVVGSTGLEVMRTDGVMQEEVFVADSEDLGGDGDGVLLDDEGRFVGLAIALPTGGRGLAAVAASDTVEVARQLLESGHVPHPWIGITGTNLGRFADRSGGDNGVVVTSVAADGPAAAAGVVTGDIVVSVDGGEVSDMSDLVDALRSAAIGTTVRLGLMRQDHSVVLDVAVADRPAATNAAAS